jgi:hypothetical protein
METPSLSVFLEIVIWTDRSLSAIKLRAWRKYVSEVIIYNTQVVLGVTYHANIYVDTLL